MIPPPGASLQAIFGRRAEVAALRQAPGGGMMPHHRSHERGQIAVTALVILAAILVFVRMIINLGQTAQVRVETSNAADAAALAAASWTASGQNEAVWVARKMHDGIALVEALYVVPFGPALVSLYPQQLSASLATKPSGGGCAPGVYEGCGPNGYFREVAGGALEAAWYVGRREFISAALNNMMMRYNTTERSTVIPTAKEADLGTSLGDGDIISDPFGSLPQEIANQQRSENESSSFSTRISGAGGLLDWNNGLPYTHSRHLTHIPTYEYHYSVAGPPRLQTTEASFSFVRYLPVQNDRHFACAFSAWGISGGPALELPAILPERPLSVDERGMKAWDMDLEDIIPAVDSRRKVTVGPTTVCGAETVTVSVSSIRPTQILDGEGDISSTVAHQVNKTNPEASTGLAPVWQTKFPNVKSGATARYTTATIPADAGAQPLRNATAYLTATQ